MNIVEVTPEEGLGPLNELERKAAAKVFYCRGDVGLLKEPAKVSIVGSRDATREGLRRAHQLAKMLVENSVTVLSGLAKGIDRAAHLAAIKEGGKTIAVLGNPLNKYYPAENRDLQEEIATKHLLVSQFALGAAGGRKNYPIRNRTMALISDATVIVEAKDKSGTLHQGWEALRLGRPLFLMESIVNNSDVAWPAEMLDYGAKVLSRENFDELISFLPTANREVLASVSL
ncbi:DNA-processing protein DprA [Haloferula sargassicola]|uniref:DNA processing protein DprA n=1 Tax=Haloferula sargassicola TaxID=490096 RepID=A0ABP9UVD1_9BACT